MSQIVLGIDPGASGAVALIQLNGKILDCWFADKETIYDIGKKLKNLSMMIHCVYIEQVWVRPEQGISSAAKFMVNYGEYRGLVAGLQVPVKYVLPAVWQRSMKCLTKGDKNVSKRRAQELFPKMDITHQNADAYLISEYGRRQEILISNDPAYQI